MTLTRRPSTALGAMVLATGAGQGARSSRGWMLHDPTCRSSGSPHRTRSSCSTPRPRARCRTGCASVCRRGHHRHPAWSALPSTAAPAAPARAVRRRPAAADAVPRCTAGDLRIDYSKHLIDDDVVRRSARRRRGGRRRGTARRDVRRRADQRDRAARRAAHRAARAGGDAVDRGRRAQRRRPTCTRCSGGWPRSPSGCAAASGAGATGERIRTVVNIGIGGSDLGPAMAYLATERVRRARTSRAASSATSTVPTSPATSPTSTRRRRCSSSARRRSPRSRR